MPTIFLGILTTLALTMVMKYTASFLIPLVIAMLITFAFMPVISFLKKKKVPYWLIIVMLMLIICIIFFLIFFFLYNSINTVVRYFPRYFVRIELLLDQLTEWLEARFNFYLPSILSEFDWFGTVRNLLFTVSGNSINLIKFLGLVILFLIFFLIESPYMENTIRKAFPQDTSRRLIVGYVHIIRDIGRYLGVKLLVSSATGFCVYLALMFIGMDFPVIWGVLAFILNFIPSIGSLFIMAATILMGFFQFYPSWGRVFLVAFFMIGIQVVWGNFIDPRLSGNRLKLSPLLIIISLFLWGWIWGIAGMFLAVPLLSVIKIICENVPQLAPLAVIMESDRGDRGTPRRRRRPGDRRQKKSSSEPRKPTDYPGASAPSED